MILLPKEVKIICMALHTMIEEMSEIANDTSLPFTPEARRNMKDMLSTAKSAKDKLEKVTGEVVQLDPYQDGDENEFFTKQS